MGALVSRSHSFTAQSKMAEENEDFEIDSADAGAASEHNVEAGQIRKGGYIMIKGKACKVRDVSTSKTGKHGHAKCKFSAVDIFTGATCEELCPSTHAIDQPFVTKKDYSIMGLEGDYPQLMDEDGEMREDLALPNVDYKTDGDNEVSNMIKEMCAEVEGGAEIDITCTVLGAIGKKKIVDVRKKDA